MRKHFTGTKNVAEEKPTKGVARLGFSGARAAVRRRSVYNPVRRRFGFLLIIK